MTEASGSGGPRAKVERRMIQRSMEDEAFRQRLLDDPKGTLEQEVGIQVPEGVEVRVVQESADTIYLVLPSASPVGQGEEISDQDLRRVAGGGAVSADSDFCYSTYSEYTCEAGCDTSGDAC